MLKSCVFFFLPRRERSYTSQTNMSLSVKSWHGYGCNHGDWLVVRSPGEGCSVGMCQTDRGAHTHCRANQKPAVSLKTIGYISETTYKFQGDLAREEKKGHFASSSLFFFNTFFSNRFDLKAPGPAKGVRYKSDEFIFDWCPHEWWIKAKSATLSTHHVSLVT